jgi:hypothetical protein
MQEKMKTDYVTIDCQSQKSVLMDTCHSSTEDSWPTSIGEVRVAGLLDVSPYEC